MAKLFKENDKNIISVKDGVEHSLKRNRTEFKTQCPLAT